MSNEQITEMYKEINITMVNIYIANLTKMVDDIKDGLTGQENLNDVLLQLKTVSNKAFKHSVETKYRLEHTHYSEKTQ